MLRAIVLLLLLAPAPSAVAAAPMTVDDVARQRAVSEVAISPDGRHIAYALSVPREPGEGSDGPAYKELHVVDAKGRSRPFVHGEVNVGRLGWTPDGKAITFVTKRGGDEKPALWAIPIDGGEARRLLTFSEGIGPYAFHPDGGQLAFLAPEAEPEGRTAARKKGFDAKVYEESARPQRVWIAELSDGAPEPRMLPLRGSASELRWSPAGDRIVVALAPTPLIDDHYMHRKVTVVSPRGGEIAGRVDNPGKLGMVRFSPNGRRLALISGADIHDPSEGRLMVASAKGGPVTDLLPGFEGAVRAVAWKDDDSLIYVADEGVWTLVGEIRADGKKNEVRVKPGGPVLRGLDLAARGGAAAMVGHGPDHLPEVYRLDRKAKEAKRLTDSNPWLADRRLGKQEVVRYEARDGMEIDGLLIRPVGARGKVPLVIVAHGGPESHYPNGWLTWYALPGQVLAGRGFAVFHPNYRGSTGRGVAFSKVSQGDPAGKEFDDLVDAVDHLVADGLADPKRVGITGGSYGGYASAWAATRYSERFAASVPFMGVTNQVSKFGTGDIPAEMTLVHFLKEPWKDWQFFLERSPVFHAGKGRTPTLILHGEADTRVDPGQARDLYRHLKLRAKAPVRLVTYPKEPHGLRRAASRYDYNRRMIRWLEHYLKGPGGDPPPMDLPSADDEKADE